METELTVSEEGLVPELVAGPLPLPPLLPLLPSALVDKP